MKAITVIRSDDGSLSINHSKELAPYELIELMHDAMEMISRPAFRSVPEEIKRRMASE